jgi:ATP-dependent Clp protease ATP-binding subunit ClpC
VGFTGGEAGRAGADSERILAAAKRAFLPEFLNRIDEVVVFESLSEGQVREIGEMLVRRIADRLYAERGIELEVAPELIARLSGEGFDPEFGARPLRRHLRRTLEKELTRAILDGRITEGGQVLALDNDEHEIVLAVRQAVTV